MRGRKGGTAWLVCAVASWIAVHGCGGTKDNPFHEADGAVGSGGAGGGCTSTDDCKASGRVCLVDERRCVDCLSSSGCAVGSDCINNVCVRGTGGASGTAGAGPGGASGSGGTGDASAGTSGGGEGGSAGTGIGGSAGTGVGGSGGVCDPLDIVLLFDASGSMGESTGSLSKWQAAVASFLAWADQARNVRVALQLHPATNSKPLPPTCTTSAECGPGGICIPTLGCFATSTVSCETKDYLTPQVPLSPLPASRAAFDSALNLKPPSGGSVLIPVLEGGIAQARKLANANPNGTTIVVLIADGPDNSCAPSEASDAWPVVTMLAHDGLAVAPSIKTHVIAIASSIAGFDAVAKAGGTTARLALNGDIGAALSAIQSEYACP